jgi:hypothetical protein
MERLMQKTRKGKGMDQENVEEGLLKPCHALSALGESASSPTKKLALRENT